MLTKNRRVFAAAIVTIFCFFTVTYFSCTKTNSNSHKCVDLVCLNGSYCHIDTAGNIPVCICPTGFEGTNCQTASVAKYIGTWNVKQTLLGSDSAYTDTFTYFTAYLVQTATPTTFFMNNFSGNPYYNQITCTIDTGTLSHNFIIDTISASHMIFDHFQLVAGTGSINTKNDTINAFFIVRHLSPTSNWIHDTLSMQMVLQ
jgi:hypothetical protein